MQKQLDAAALWSLSEMERTGGEPDVIGRDKKTENGADYMVINPKGYVPALEIAPGDVLTENVVLHGYVAGLNPAAKLAPAPGTKERLKLDELSVFVSTEVHKASRRRSRSWIGQRSVLSNAFIDWLLPVRRRIRGRR